MFGKCHISCILTTTFVDFIIDKVHCSHYKRGNFSPLYPISPYFSSGSQNHCTGCPILFPHLCLFVYVPIKDVAYYDILLSSTLYLTTGYFLLIQYGSSTLIWNTFKKAYEPLFCERYWDINIPWSFHCFCLISISISQIRIITGKMSRWTFNL